MYYAIILTSSAVIIALMWLEIRDRDKTIEKEIDNYNDLQDNIGEIMRIKEAKITELTEKLNGK